MSLDSKTTGCAAEPLPPTLRGELRRGVNRSNLSVGLAAGVVIGFVAWGLAQFGFWPPPQGWSVLKLGAAAGTVGFLASTMLHTAMHGYFGWRFERGLAALAAGQRTQAARMLAPAARRGMDHYDPHGIAKRGYEAARLND